MGERPSHCTHDGEFENCGAWNGKLGCLYNFTETRDMFAQDRTLPRIATEKYHFSSKKKPISRIYFRSKPIQTVCAIFSTHMLKNQWKKSWQLLLREFVIVFLIVLFHTREKFKPKSCSSIAKKKPRKSMWLLVFSRNEKYREIRNPTSILHFWRAGETAFNPSLAFQVLLPARRLSLLNL